MIKHILLLAMLLASLGRISEAATYYVAPGGNNNNPGTQAAPFATPARGITASGPGDTIFLRGGTYTNPVISISGKSGTAGNHINLWEFPGETAVLSGGAGIVVSNSSWWHFRGFRISRISYRCINVGGASSEIIMEQLECDFPGQSGLVYNGTATGRNIQIINNDVNNTLGGGNGDCIQITDARFSGSVIRGNRAWNCGDDGIDTWNSAPVLVENNWVWDAGKLANGQSSGGNGNGFKLGGNATDDGGHLVRNNLCWNNAARGFHENGANVPDTLYNNTAFGNSHNYVFTTGVAHVLRNNIAFSGFLANFQVGGGAQASFNSWQLPVTANAADFVSLSSDALRTAPRNADGSLPSTNFLRLVAGSDLIDRGTNVGIPFSGSAPDLGAVEFVATTTTGAPPAAHWPFNETSGTIAFDASPNANHLTLSGGASFTTGRIGNALSVNGTTGRAVDTVTTGLNAVSALTTAAWIRPTLFRSTPSTIVRKGFRPDRGYAMIFFGNRLTFNKINGTSVGSVTVPVDGQFHHIATTFNVATGQIQFYLDGVLRETLTNPGALDAPLDTDPVSVGYNLDEVGADEGSPFSGLIDDVRIYHRVLPASEIAGLMNPDSAPPSIALTAPANGSTVAGSVPVSATAADNFGVSGVQFLLDGANLGAEDIVSPYTVTWNTTGASDGNHTLTARARDAAGNTNISGAFTVIVDNVPTGSAPTASITAPANGASVSGDAVTVSAVASDDVAVAGVQFRLDGANLGAEDLTSPYSIVWNTTTAINGSHALTAVARDTSGNIGTSAAVVVTVNNTSGTTIIMGEQNILSIPDSGHANILIAQQNTLAQPATIQSISFYIATPNGNLRLGLYDSMGPGGGPGSLRAETPSFTPVAGFNTRNVILPAFLAPGNYWIAFLTSSQQLFYRAESTGGIARFYQVPFGALPATFSTTPSSSTYRWSLFATLTPSAPDTAPPNVSITSPVSGATVAGIVTVRASASDSVALAGVQFKLDGVNLGAEDTEEPFESIWNTTQFSQGPHVLTAVARDSSGNLTTSTAVGVLVNNEDICP